MYKQSVNFVRNYSKRRPGLSQLKAHKAKEPKISPAVLYIPTSKFPSAPDHIMNMSTDQLYESTNTKIPVKKPNAVNFEIPKNFSKQYQNSLLTQRDFAMLKQLEIMMNTDDEKVILESQIILGNLYSDKDTFASYIPEHPLKKSLSGMINLNPHLNDIDDEYLWDLIPPNKLFGEKFYEEEGSFKEWEKDMLEEKTRLLDHLKVHEVEISDFLQKYGKNKSFLTKKNRRYKLNKSLIKAYKELKSKNLHIKKLDGKKDDDLEFEFVLEESDDFNEKKS